MRNILAFCLLFFSVISSFAQETHVEMADTMRENGKIYVVVVVVCILFAGIVFYLVSLDKKLTRLEKEIKKDK